MPWYAPLTPAVGKLIRSMIRLTRHGGSALPGKIIEAIDPGFLRRTLNRLPYGVVLVSGTNGKTTTTRMVSTMLQEMGLDVFTNPTGSNFTRGIVSSLLAEIGLDGRLHADIAVLELDEAYAVHFVRHVSPRYSLLLNVMRDQLDRFGEIDTTARLLGQVAEATTGTIVLNREDGRIRRLAAHADTGVAVRYFGLADELRSYFPSDDEMYAWATTETARAQNSKASADQSATESNSPSSSDLPAADVVLADVEDHRASFIICGTRITTQVALEGIYNVYNAAAALAMAETVIEKTIGHPDAQDLAVALSHVTPAFGRGEIIQIETGPVELVLVKNPMGFRLSLQSFAAAAHKTMIAICDQYADGRDMSWLWDVDFRSLRETGVAMVSGDRAWDMALRLGYDGVCVAQTDPDLESAVERFVMADAGIPKRIFCTYTSMLRVRAKLSHMTDVADAGVGR